MFKWTFSIGDPTLYGWIATLGYLLAASLALRCLASMRPAGPESRNHPLRRERWLWMIVALFLLALALNKQLDLQTLVTDVTRQMAKDQGWYPRRRAFQREFVMALAAGGILCMAAIATAYARAGRWVWLAITGLMLLAGFIVLRAASFHHADLPPALDGIVLDHLLEQLGIGTVVIAAIGRAGQHRAGVPPRA